MPNKQRVALDVTDSGRAISAQNGLIGALISLHFGKWSLSFDEFLEDVGIAIFSLSSIGFQNNG